MKFSHSLLFNSVPEWSDHYIRYDHLKDVIYKFEKVLLEQGAMTDTVYRDEEEAPIRAPTPIDHRKIFTRLLDQELHKINTFYEEREHELFEEVDDLNADILRIEQEDSLAFAEGGSDDSGSESDTNVHFRESVFSTYDRPSYERLQLARDGDGPQPSHAAADTPGSLDKRAGGGDAPAKRKTSASQSRDKRRASAGQNSDRRLSAGSGNSRGARRASSSRRGQVIGQIPYGEEEIEGAGVGVWAGTTDWAIDMRIMYKRRVASLYTSLSELKQYVQLNYTGFRKIIKKYDKITQGDLSRTYLVNTVNTAYVFAPETDAKLVATLEELVPLFADMATLGNLEYAKRQLNAHLREHVVWERNTVWREMIGLERRGWADAGRSRRAGAIAGASRDVPVIEDALGDAEAYWPLETPCGVVSLPPWVNAQTTTAVIAVLLFLYILNAPWFERPEEQNCLALLVFVTIMWAFEVVPLFVTALMVPFLVIVLRVLRSTEDDSRLSAPLAAKFIFSQMFSPTIMLLLGGFTLASALSKQNIDKILATQVLSLAGTRPKTILFAYMAVACFASMWISNVAAPVMCYSLIQPILRTLPAKSSFSKALILGIALASNIGGMASPISSAQNLIALEYMNPPLSWLQWFAISIPVALTSIVLIWLLLLWSYDAAGTKGAAIAINPIRINREPWTRPQYFVLAVSALTIILWCIQSKIAWIVGDMGVIAIIPIVLFYGSGILRKVDFDHSPWSIVFLAMGGISLGKAVLSSGLLDDLDAVIENLVQGMSLWPILALFACIVLVIATVISHTIASVLAVPIAAQLGAAMDSSTPHDRLLIMATALVCSAGMGLPISGFPNLQAINVEDDVGQRYLEPRDFFVNGVPASLITLLVIITLGFVIMSLIGL